MARIQIESMTLEEKLEAMELLWDDLCRRAETYEPPQWHGEVLARRKEMIRRGEAKYVDLEDLKERIMKDLR